MIWNLYLKDNKVFDMEEIEKKTQKPYMMYASMGDGLSDHCVF